MFIAALLTITEMWKQPKYPSIDKWMKKLWYMHTMEYYLVIKKNKVSPPATVWMDLESIMLSDISQIE